MNADELMLDEPFHDSNPDESPLPFKLITLKPPRPVEEETNVEIVELDAAMLPYIIDTPIGQELVMAECFDEDTKIYNMVELAALLADCHPHRHTTQRSMHAVTVNE